MTPKTKGVITLDKKAITVEIGIEEYLKLQDLRVESLKTGRFVSVGCVMRDALKHYLQEVDLREKYLQQAEDNKKDSRGGNHNHPPHTSHLHNTTGYNTIRGDTHKGGDVQSTKGGELQSTQRR